MDATKIEKIKNSAALLDVRQPRLYLAREAKALGSGTVSQTSKIAGVSRMAVFRGLKEVEAPDFEPGLKFRSRKKGGGRKPPVVDNPGFLSKLDELMEAFAAGSLENPLKRTGKSLRKIRTARQMPGGKERSG
jgi:hypothetical protein